MKRESKINVENGFDLIGNIQIKTHKQTQRHTQMRTHPDLRTIILKGSGCVLQTVGDGSTGRLVGTRQTDIPV